jgi:hypothetical protein
VSRLSLSRLRDSNDLYRRRAEAIHGTLVELRKVYQQVLGISRDPPMFKASVGLLLRDDLHHAYDRLEWSLYYRVSSGYVRRALW